MAAEKIDAEAGVQALKEMRTLGPAEMTVWQFIKYNFEELKELRDRGYSSKQIHRHLQNRIGLKCTANTFSSYLNKAYRIYS